MKNDCQLFPLICKSLRFEDNHESAEEAKFHSASLEIY